jgi:signal transduction histidine kinase/ligand-binding sensor domain-containing protein
VYQLIQDASGRLWVLTQAGIASYDGAGFQVQTARHGLPTTRWGALSLDDRGRPLAATLDGQIFRNEGGAWRREAPAIGAESAEPVLLLGQVVQQGREKFVAATTDALWQWADGGWQRVGAESNPWGGVAALTRWGDELLLGTDSGLCRLSGRSLNCAYGESPRLREPILALQPAIVAGQTSLLVLSQHWLGVLTNGRLELRSEALGPLQRYAPRQGIANSTAALNMDATGTLYFGTPYRAFLLESGAEAPLELGPEQGLLGEGATSILLDREGAIWIGNLRGLNRLGSRRFQSMDARTGLVESEVSSIAEIAPGRFLLGHNTGLTILDANLKRLGGIDLSKPLGKLPPGIARILDIAVDASGTAWAAASTVLIEIGRDRRPKIHTFPGERVLSVEFDRGGRLWVLGSGSLYLRRSGRFDKVAFNVPREDPAVLVRWLHADHRGRLFVASNAGLFWRDAIKAADLGEKASWERARSMDRRGENIYAVSTAEDGGVVVGTGGGLYQLSGALLRETTGPLALGRPVYFLLRDRASTLWAGTDDGVFVSEGSGFRQLTVRHGLAGRETNRGAGIMDSFGRLWIGTDQGFSIYREPLDLRPALPPIVELDGLTVEGETHGTAETLNLSGSPRSLVFHARSISFSPEEQAVCRYRLEGLDEDWQGPAPLTTAGLRYTHIPPGRYRLKVAAAWNANGPWGPEVISQEIRIPTPLWQRPLVWFLLIFSLGAAIWSGHHLRLKRLGLRNAQLESLNDRLRTSVLERQRLIAELETKNAELERFTYTVSHDLKAPLVTIRGFAGLVEQDAREGRIEQVQADVPRIRKAAETMGHLLEQLLELSRIGRVVGPLAAIPLTPLITEAAERVPGIESVDLVVAPDLPTIMGDRTRLLEVFENLLGNAVKFSCSPPAPRIEVSLREGPEAVIVVADNGVGIDPKFKERVFDLFERLDKSVPGTGIGLAIVKRIVESHGGRIWVESTGVRGLGSRFCLTLPRSLEQSVRNEPAPSERGRD